LFGNWAGKIGGSGDLSPLLAASLSRPQGDTPETVRLEVFALFGLEEAQTEADERAEGDALAMNQLALSLVCGPRSRRRDPETSRLAAEIYAPHAGTDAAIVLAVVKEFPGLTYRAIHARCNGAIPEAVGVMRRLADLELAGLVRKGPATIGPNGRMAASWFAVED